MKRLIFACLVAIASLSSAQGANDLPRAPRAGILPGEPQQTPFPSSCNPQGLAQKVLELLDQPPTIVAPSTCAGLASVCQSQDRVDALAQALAEEQELLSLKMRIVALANRCI